MQEIKTIEAISYLPFDYITIKTEDYVKVQNEIKTVKEENEKLRNCEKVIFLKVGFNSEVSIITTKDKANNYILNVLDKYNDRLTQLRVDILEQIDKLSEDKKTEIRESSLFKKLFKRS